VLLVAAACGAAQVERVPDAVRAEWNPPRLPQTVRPLAYRLDLQVIPGEDLQGTVEIDVEVLEPTRVVYLNARNLKRVDGHAVVGGRTLPLTVAKASDSVLGLTTDERFRGNATLVLQFTAPVGLEPKGAFFRKVKGEIYVYTQFEPTWARRAFPCFDEPGWKTPWQVTLRVHPWHGAFSNAPIASERREGGLKVVTFKPTPPLPTYLVAFAVGDLRVAEGGRTRGGVPVRFISPGAPNRTVADAARKFVDDLEAYLGVPFPFEKLDLVFVPGFNGGMENAGLITLGDTDPYIVAHEVAHQWFGDLVTAAWWNHIWLHESFATWLGQKVSPDEWRTAGVLFADPGVVLQPRVDEDDVEARASFEKGGAILGMVESWIGEETFRGIVREFLLRHAWKSVATDDFLALAPDAKPVLESFLSRPGSPDVEMELDCATRPQLRVRQRVARPFTIPICIRAEVGERCQVVAEPTATIPLGDVCPSWLAPNRDGRGFYTVVPGKSLSFVFEQSARLRDSERSRLLIDLMRGFVSRQLPAGDALPLVEAVGRSAGRGSKEILDFWRRLLDPMVPDEARRSFTVFSRRVLGAAAVSVSEADATRQFEAWLQGQSVERIDTIIPVAVGGGDAAMFARLRAEMARAGSDRRSSRPLYLGMALGSFRDSALAAEALKLADAGEIPRKLVGVVLTAMATTPETRPLARRYLLDRSPEDAFLQQPSTVWELLRTICDEPTLKRAREWVPADQKERADYALAEARRCIELRAYHEPSLRAFLATINP
jgi:hypothetical protein